MAEKQIQSELVYDDECSFIRGDYDRIRQLFIIILQNAIKYSEPDTHVYVHVMKNEDTIQVSIADEGVGIATEDLENIFEKFYRGQNHTEKDGSGLGLVVARHIVERHEGRIHAESEIGKGSTFIIDLPACEPPDEDW